MKKTFYLFLLLIGSITTNAQTHVGGGIYSNTTWTKANSPYIVDQHVVVFPGYTLTIEPGTEVRFRNNQHLEVRGALVTLGNAADSITFTSDSVTPAKGAWEGLIITGTSSGFSYVNMLYSRYAIYLESTVSVTIKHCRFGYNWSGLEVSLSSGKYAPLKIDSCYFWGNNIGVSAMYIGKVTNSKFENNSAGINLRYQDTMINCVLLSNGTGMSADGTVKNCIFKYNDVAANVGYLTNLICNEITENNVGLVASQPFKHSGNKISNNVNYNLKLAASHNVALSNICWGETDSAIIAAKIYDGRTNSALGLFSFMPFMPCSSGTTVDSVCTAQPLGIFQPAKKSNLQAYPNPMITATRLSLDESFIGAEIGVFNALGQKVQALGKTESTDITIYRNDLPAGLYFIVVSKAGSSQSIKLMITD